MSMSRQQCKIHKIELCLKENCQHLLRKSRTFAESHESLDKLHEQVCTIYLTFLTRIIYDENRSKNLLLEHLEISTIVRELSKPHIRACATYVLRLTCVNLFMKRFGVLFM